MENLVAEFEPYLSNSLIQEGLQKLAINFASEKHTGPKFVADFEEITDFVYRLQIKRDAFERANYLLGALSIV